MVNARRLWALSTIALAFTPCGLRAMSLEPFAPTAEFSLFRALQYARAPGAEGGNGYDDIGSARTYLEAGVSLAATRQTGPVTWDGMAALFARQLFMQDLWRHASLPHMTYETCPLALQYSERQYRLALTPRLPLTSDLTMSSQFTYDLVRGGSNLWRSNESSVSFRAATLSQALLVRPALQLTSKTALSSLYLLLAQYTDNVLGEFSYQTFAGIRGDLSVGATSIISIPAFAATIQPTLVHYSFVFNDPADDFVREGALLQTSQQLPFSLAWSLTLGWLRDRYREPFVSFDNCRSIAGGSSTAPMSQCRRTDRQYIFSPELHYDYTADTRLTFSWLMQRRVNPELPLLEQTDHEILFGVEITPHAEQKGQVPHGELWRDFLALRLHPARE